MKYSIPAILSWDPFSVLGRCLHAINWSEVMDKRFLPLLKKKKKKLFKSSDECCHLPLEEKG